MNVIIHLSILIWLDHERSRALGIVIQNTTDLISVCKKEVSLSLSKLVQISDLQISDLQSNPIQIKA